MNEWNKDNKTILTLQMGDTKTSWETSAPCNDVPLDTLIQTFYAQLISFTYTPSSVLEEFRAFADEHQPYVDPDYQRDTEDLSEDDK